MSPTLTAKSRAVPGVAGLMRPPAPISLSGLGVSEQAASARAMRKAPQKPTPALRHLKSSILRPLPRAQSKPRAATSTVVVLADASFKNVTAAQQGENGWACKWQLNIGCFPHNARAVRETGWGTKKSGLHPSMQP